MRQSLVFLRSDQIKSHRIQTKSHSSPVQLQTDTHTHTESCTEQVFNRSVTPETVSYSNYFERPQSSELKHFSDSCQHPHREKRRRHCIGLLSLRCFVFMVTGMDTLNPKSHLSAKTQKQVQVYTDLSVVQPLYHQACRQREY